MVLLRPSPMTSIQDEAFPSVFTNELLDWLASLRMDVLLPLFFDGYLRDYCAGYVGINRWRVPGRTSSDQE